MRGCRGFTKGRKLRQVFPNGQDSNPGLKVGENLKQRLHPLRNLNSQELQAFSQDTAAQFAQGETRAARRLLRFQDGTRFVESVEGVREFVEIICEQVRT